MAPTITSAVIYSNEIILLMTLLFLHLRMPVVEKLRRDHFNNSIEQIKSLLGRDPQPAARLQAGESRHLGDDSLLPETTATEPIVHFLSKDEVKTQTQRRLLSHFQSLHPSSDKNRRESDLPQFSSQAKFRISKEKSPVNIALWRPW
uniref:Uncharacterized protein n=1 Tax=Oncorhynchus kisutch TaxID=8019 RepID=A0A8C7F063_ONCKI